MFCIGNFLLQIFALEGFVKACPVGLTDSLTHKALKGKQCPIQNILGRCYTLSLSLIT